MEYSGDYWKSYGLGGKVIDWFTSYLNNKKQQVCTTTSSSVPLAVLFGVPESSVLGPILFLLYTSDLLQLVKRHHLTPPAYADDTQIYGDYQLIQQVSVCIDEVSAWMKANQLQLNPAKTEVLWCASSRLRHQIPTGPVRVGDALINTKYIIKQ